MPTKHEVKELLNYLGYQPREKFNPPYEWVWIIEPVPGFNMGIAPSPGKPSLQADFSLTLDDPTVRQLKAKLGNQGVGELIAKMKLLLLNAQLDYAFRPGGESLREIIVFGHVTPDAITPYYVESLIGRVKNAFFQISVAIQLGLNAGDTGAAGPKSLDEMNRAGAIVATVTTLSVEPETSAKLTENLLPGQTVDELVQEALTVRAQVQNLLQPGETPEQLIAELKRRRSESD